MSLHGKDIFGDQFSTLDLLVDLGVYVFALESLSVAFLALSLFSLDHSLFILVFCFLLLFFSLI